MVNVVFISALAQMFNVIIMFALAYRVEVVIILALACMLCGLCFISSLHS